MSRAENRKYHYIYKTTCTATSKFYIGMHSTDDLEDGYKGSGKRLWYSIQKHGIENHNTEILEFFLSRDELKRREAQLVNEELLNDSQCMNLKIGGDGGGHLWNDEHRIKWIAAGRSTPERMKKINGTIAKRKKEIPGYADSLRKKLSNNAKGNKSFLGKNHSNETKEKMRDSHLGKHTKEKNSQFGTCWICNEELQENKKIKKEELEQWLESGWIKGRNKFRILPVTEC